MAGVIRKEQLTDARPFSFADLEEQGRQIIQHAQAQAEQILQNSRAEDRRLSEEHRQAGYQAGLTAGRTEGLEQIRAEAHANAVREARDETALLLRSLSRALEEFEQCKRNLVAAAESGLIELALAIARRVCKLTIGTSHDAVRANARTLLEMVQHADDAELHFNPAEYELLREMGPDLLAQTEQFAHVELVADERVDLGDCLLRAHAGEIDAAVETQLDRIAAALLVKPDTGQSRAKA